MAGLLWTIVGCPFGGLPRLLLPSSRNSGCTVRTRCARRSNPILWSAVGKCVEICASNSRFCIAAATFGSKFQHFIVPLCPVDAVQPLLKEYWCLLHATFLWVESILHYPQAIFIITSNIGADVIKKDAKEYTASRTTAEQRRELESAWWQRIVHTLQQTYTAPFLNRSTANLFVFTPYTRAECERAVTLELQRWARHLVTATGPLVQWTQTVVKFFADNFDQFHGQKVVTSCADALNAAMNDGHESRYFLLTVSASQLRAEPLAEAVQRVKAPPRILRSALPAELLSDTAACPDDPQALLAAVLGLVPGTAPSLPSAVAPVGDNPPTPPPRPPAPAPPETSAQDTAPSGGASEAEWRRETEPEREMALIHKEREILALQQRALQSEAETEQLRQQLAQAQAENEALQATVADKDREIASLLETVKALQMSVLVLLFTSCFLVWVMTWLVPTELLMMGVLAMGFGIWMAWGRLSWWLLPVLGALKKVLGEQGTAILLFVLLVLIAHRLKSGPVQWGCSQGEGFD